MLIIHGGFSYPTRLAYSYVPDPLFRVYVGSIHKAKVRKVPTTQIRLTWYDG